MSATAAAAPEAEAACSTTSPPPPPPPPSTAHATPLSAGDDEGADADCGLPSDPHTSFESAVSQQVNDGDPAAAVSAQSPANIKQEPADPHNQAAREPEDPATDPDTNHDAATLRPAPTPSAKRRESEAALSTPDPDIKRPLKRRKRAASPPWQFPTAENTTLKTADGRRISARVNTSTPGLSEPEERGRSGSLSASRSRPASPPWKRFAAAGPTTLQVDGVRKSGRVNKELADPPKPKRVSPRTKKTVDKLSTPQHADKASATKQTAAMGGSSKKPAADRKQVNGVERYSMDTESSRKIAELQAQIAALQPSRSFPAPTNGVNGHDQPKSAHRRKQSQDTPMLDAPASPPSRRKTHRLSSASQSPEKSKPTPKIKLRFSGPRHVIPPAHPHAQPPTPPRPPQLSVYQIIEKYELKEMQQPYTENERGPPDAEEFARRAVKAAEEESAMRQRLLKESQPGGALSREHLSLFQDERQPEPPQQYDHQDHLVAHAVFLRTLQIRENAAHRLLAKRIAYEAVDQWKKIHGPTEEDLIVEENKRMDLIKKQVVADLKAKWELVEAHVQELKKKAWEAEQERIRAEKLQKKLEYSETLLAKQRGNADSDIEMDGDSMISVDNFEEEGESEGDADGEDDEDSEVAENMSESGSDSGGNEVEDEGEMDEEALAAYLAQRQAEPPDKLGDGEQATSLVNGEDVDMGTDTEQAGSTHDQSLAATPGPRDNEAGPNGANDGPDETGADETKRRLGRRDQEVKDASLTKEEAEAEEHLSSDESTEMYDSDEDMSSTGDEAELANDNHDDDDDEDDESDDPDGGPSLLSLYSAKDLLRDRAGGLPTPVTSVENGGDNDNPRPVSEARSDSQAEAGAATNSTTDKMDVVPTEPPRDSAAEIENIDQAATENVEHEDQPMEEDLEPAENANSRVLVPAPTMLRGTLRTYQQAGLDWLASLYRNGTNGILADEMGLGKTIQTISLLAHLAEVHEVWETHLVIVPTSVILNWVTEFQKFLPGFRVLGYYGSAEERQFKRRGWTNDPHHEQKDKRGYNVVVTSYNVAMQDINAIRNVQWHYLILDEAHNIRNFNSQRWQVLIRLRTRARLLLTGTPLQNDLAEVWSLLTFLTAGDDDRSHGPLEEFLSNWKDPVKEIFDQGVQKLSGDAQAVVDNLHTSLRPYLLRRKKNEVEKDLPKKTESVVVCKLSKRQRQLYQDYMGLAETKATLAKGSGVQAGAVLLSLRRVCNHPDLFDPRPIQTSFAMESSPLDDYTTKEQLLRRLLGVSDVLPAKLILAGNEGRRRAAVRRSQALSASGTLLQQFKEMDATAIDRNPDPATLTGSRALQRLRQHERKLQQLRVRIRATETWNDSVPVYGSDLRELLTVHKDRPYTFSPRREKVEYLQGWLFPGHKPLRVEHPIDLSLARKTALHQDVATLDTYAECLQETIIKFAFVPPAVTVPILNHAIPRKIQESIRLAPQYPVDIDFGHEARVRTSIAFPDSRLLIFDSGKLQRLVYLLRELQSRGSRSLIFTQMTGTLNILEQFLSLMNLPYLRLDGSTPVERRQLYSAEFNRPESKYQCMILSSRAGGVGLNLTGASSVIFYDLDWNPQMDRQCMDRAHRIGQVRDVEVYKMVSEKTVEENILRRANQKSLLDQAIIQDGHFTTEYELPRQQDESGEGGGDEVAAAIERFLGGEEKNKTKALESVEDKEDVQAAQQAAKEDRQDDIDFVDRSSKGPSKANTPGPGGEVEDVAEDDRQGHVDGFMIKFMKAQLQDWVYVPPPVRRLDKHGRDPSHRPKRKR